MTFDLENARAVCKTLPKYMNGACPCKEEAEAAKMLIKALPEIERLRAELARVNQARETEIDQAGAAERIYLEGVRAKDVRIKELEDALAEYQRLGKTIAGKVPDADECPDDLPPIGSPYRSWQITDERKAAIQWASEMAGDCKAGDVLRAMLEAEQ